MTATISNLAADLRAFTGSETFYRHSLMRAVRYTEGVKYLAEQAGAYWLLDKIATEQMRPAVKAEEFQVWKLRVADGRATLTVEDGNDNKVAVEAITFTDFPEPGVDLWFAGGTIMLPSEY